MNSEATWLEVSLLVDGEMAEAAAEVLGRFVPGGVVIESTEISDELDGAGYPVGKLRVCGYLPVDQDLKDNRQRLEKAFWYLGRIRPLPEPVFKPIVETNWVESWKNHYQPVTAEKHLMKPSCTDEQKNEASRRVKQHDCLAVIFIASEPCIVRENAT